MTRCAAIRAPAQAEQPAVKVQHRVWIGVLRRNVDPAVVRIHRQPGHCAVRAETRIRAGVPLHRVRISSRLRRSGIRSATACGTRRKTVDATGSRASFEAQRRITHPDLPGPCTPSGHRARSTG